jgi:hypothetical protein
MKLNAFLSATVLLLSGVVAGDPREVSTKESTLSPFFDPQHAGSELQIRQDIRVRDLKKLRGRVLSDPRKGGEKGKKKGNSENKELQFVLVRIGGTAASVLVRPPLTLVLNISPD